jgi:hypothetical protein
MTMTYLWHREAPYWRRDHFQLRPSDVSFNDHHADALHSQRDRDAMHRQHTGTQSRTRSLLLVASLGEYHDSRTTL